MTLDECREWIERIRNAKFPSGNFDAEAAHSLEDELYREVLQLAADGEDVKKLATLALTTQDIDFPRWCA